MSYYDWWYKWLKFILVDGIARTCMIIQEITIIFINYIWGYKQKAILH